MSTSSNRLSAENIAARVAANVATHSRSSVPATDEKEHSQILVDKIDPNPYQPRIDFNEDAMTRLVASIDRDGLIQPISVRRASGGRYQIVQGERRLRAHKILGKTSIEAMLVNIIDDRKMATLALAENISRDDLSDYETAKGIHAVDTVFGSRTELAEEIGINRTDMYRYLAFFDLPTQLLAALDTNPLLFGRAACVKIKAAIEKHDSNPSLESVLSAVVEKLTSGDLDQLKAHAFIDQMLSEAPAVAPKEKAVVIKCGKKNLGDITKTDKVLTLRLKRKTLSEEQESRLMAFVESLSSE